MSSSHTRGLLGNASGGSISSAWGRRLLTPAPQNLLHTVLPGAQAGLEPNLRILPTWAELQTGAPSCGGPILSAPGSGLKGGPSVFLQGLGILSTLMLPNPWPRALRPFPSRQLPQPRAALTLLPQDGHLGDDEAPWGAHLDSLRQVPGEQRKGGQSEPSSTSGANL